MTANSQSPWKQYLLITVNMQKDNSVIVDLDQSKKVTFY